MDPCTSSCVCRTYFPVTKPVLALPDHTQPFRSSRMPVISPLCLSRISWPLNCWHPVATFQSHSACERNIHYSLIKNSFLLSAALAASPLFEGPRVFEICRFMLTSSILRLKQRWTAPSPLSLFLSNYSFIILHKPSLSKSCLSSVPRPDLKEGATMKRRKTLLNNPPPPSTSQSKLFKKPLSRAKLIKKSQKLRTKKSPKPRSYLEESLALLQKDWKIWTWRMAILHRGQSSS